MSTDAAEGVLLGLACGDALGQPVEGWPADRIEAEYGTLDAMTSGSRGLGAGAWTDDTEQAVRLARSVVERGAFDPDDVAERFVGWYRGGPTGIGGLTRAVLGRVAGGEPWREVSRDEWERRPEGRNAGNGSVMRCAPLAVAFDPPELAAASRESSRVTHWDPRCVSGCELLNRVVSDLLVGADDPLSGDVPEELRGALDGLDDRDPDSIRPSGYVVDTLEAGLYHGLGAGTLEDAVVGAVNAGGDTDTIGAVAGAVAGARFGAGAVPDRWLASLHGVDDLRALGRELHEGSFDVRVDGG